MKYVLNIYDDLSASDEMTPEQIGEAMQAYEAFDRELMASGAFVAGEALQPPGAATTVSVRDGERLVTDGPFAETKEQIGGFYLLECEDLDEAIEWAAKIPDASRSGTVEIRPVLSFE